MEAVHFYAQGIVGRIDTTEVITSGDYLITGREFMNTLDKKGLGYNILDKGDYYKVSELTPEFINPATREKALKQYYFLQIR